MTSIKIFLVVLFCNSLPQIESKRPGFTTAQNHS